MSLRFSIFGLLVLVSGGALAELYRPVTDESLDRQIGLTNDVAELQVIFLGTSSMLISDGVTNILVDGYFSRPRIVRSFLGNMKSSRGLVSATLKKLDLDDGSQLTALLVGHGHFDHSLDAAMIASITGAEVIGGTSIGRQLDRHRATPGDSPIVFSDAASAARFTFGGFTVTPIGSEHGVSPPWLQKRIAGPQKESFGKRTTLFDYKLGEVYAYLIEHDKGSILVTTTVGKLEALTESLQVDAVFLAIGFLEKETPSIADDYLNIVSGLNPEVVVPIHWDNFYKPLRKPLVTSLFNAKGVQQSVGLIKEQFKDSKIVPLDGFECLLFGKRASHPNSTDIIRNYSIGDVDTNTCHLHIVSNQAKADRI